MQKILEFLKKNNRSIKDQTIFYIEGFKEAVLAHDVLVKIVKRDGWAGVKTASIKAELDKVKDWDLFGGAVRTTYTDRKRTTPWVSMYEIRGGKLINVVPGGAEFIQAP